MLAGCNVISGASDLRSDTSEASDPDAAVTGGEPASPPRAEAGAGDGGSAAFDAGPDGGTGDGGRLREVTFESGLVGLPFGADAVSGAPQLVGGAPMAGQQSMLIERAPSFATVNLGSVSELYATFLVRILDLNAATDTIARFVPEGAGAPIDVTVDKESFDVRVGLAGGSSNAKVGANDYRVGVHIRSGTGNGVLELYVALRNAAFGPPAYSSATQSLGRITGIRLGQVGAGNNGTFMFDDLLVDSSAMPSSP